MKNKKMGILAVLVMLVAVTLNAVGGTYAKYISTYGMTDEARVAKWDFRDKAVNEVDLFESSYTNDNGVYVASSDASKVLAPGTEGVYNYQIEGTAETNFQISGSTKIVNKVILATKQSDWNPSTLIYDPVEFNLNGEWKRLSELGVPVTYDAEGNAQLVYENTDVDSTVYAANTMLTGTTAVKGSIEWRWAFEANDDNAYSNDTMDTKLGNDVVTNKELKITAEIGVAVVQTEAQPTPATKKPLSLSNKLNRVEALAESNAKDVAAYGMDAADTEEVIFNGISLTGTIKKNNSALATQMFGDMATGYYYALVVPEDTARLEWTGQLKDGTERTLGWNNLKAGEVVEIGLYKNADAEKAKNKFTMEFKTAKDGESLQRIDIDYSNLTFAE